MKLAREKRILSRMQMKKFWPLLAIALAGCAWHRHPHAQRATGPRLVGTVAFVNESLHFVLIDTGTFYSPAEGTALKSFAGKEESAVLAVSPEHQRPFITADIVKGEPHRGDLVYE